MKRLILIAATLAVAGAVPAAANQTTNAQMPFPALMNALFGPEPAARTTTRQAAPARAAQPVRDYRQPQTAGRISGRTSGRGDASFVLPGERQPAYSSRNVQSPAGRTRSRNAQTRGSTRNVAALQRAPRTRTTQATRGFNPAFAPKVVAYSGPERKGTIIINTNERFLYLVQGDGTAKRYGVGVGRPGFEWRGTHKVTRKAEWPDWRPPAQMRKRQPGLPHFMPGGPNNPLGARALYLGSTLYRIHGSNEPWSIGHAVSSGCIRMRNEDVIDLYERVGVGATVKVI